MMKNLIAITCFVVALVSCNKVEHKLEGKWQLKTVEANGVVQTVDTVWYNFQTSLFEYQLYDPAKDVYRTNSVIRRWRRYETGSGVGQLWRYTFGTIHALYGLDLT
mgnify:CR=1 FL=1